MLSSWHYWRKPESGGGHPVLPNADEVKAKPWVSFFGIQNAAWFSRGMSRPRSEEQGQCGDGARVHSQEVRDVRLEDNISECTLKCAMTFTLGQLHLSVSKLFNLPVQLLSVLVVVI